MTIRFLTAPLCAALTLLALAGCKKDNGDTQPGVGTVALEFEHVANGPAGAQDVATDGTTAYTTPSNETFTLTTLEYYVSNVELLRGDGSAQKVPGVYHLVDVARPATNTFTMKDIPVGDYTGLRFMVGVDSTTTKADPTSFTGTLNDLNPANAMYWTWDSGHIFFKLEGKVTSAGDKPLTAHIGGFRKPYNALVTATVPFPSGTKLLVRADHAPEVHLAADVLKVFDGATHLQLSTFPTAMMPSATSVQVAQNYAAGMFSVEHIHAN